jgi:uncharacterized membrane protein YkvA (DUF1232 family)
MGTGLGGRIVRGALFARLTTKAIAYLKDPDKLRDLVRQTRTKADGAAGSAALKDMWQSLLSMLRLLRAYANGQYRNVPGKSLILIVAGILYFLLPIDVIPDFLLGVGFLDDAAVLAWVFNAVRKVLDDFSQWEASRPTSALDDTV